MMRQTNIVIIDPQMGNFAPATRVDMCDQCGGLFAVPGPMFMGATHACRVGQPQ